MNSIPKKIALLTSLGLLLLTSGCFDTKEDFTINPDGSGKVVHECSFQNVNLSNEKQDPDEALRSAVREVLENSKGVEAWRDVSFKQLDDGRLFFRGTAYFKDLSKLEIPNQTMLEFEWKKAADGGASLILRTNKSAAPEGVTIDVPIEKKTRSASTNKLSPEELAKKLKQERMQFQQSKPMLAGFLGNLKQSVVIHPPGKVTGSSNFAKDPSGALTIHFEGAKLMEVMEKLVNDDEWCRKHGGTGFDNMEDKPVMDDEINQLVFGEKAPVRATIAGGAAPLFDYAAEVAAAKKEFAKTEKELGAGPVSLAPPAQGGPLKSLRVVGVRLVRESDQKRDLRPFNYDAEYSLALLIEFSGSVQSVSGESALETALTDDGASLLPDEEFQRKIHFPHLSSDKTAAILELELKVPGRAVNGLQEVSGHVQYHVAGGVKEVDLGWKN